MWEESQTLGNLILPFFLGLTKTSTKTNEYDFVIHLNSTTTTTTATSHLKLLCTHVRIPTDTQRANLLRHSARDRIAEYFRLQFVRLWIAFLDRTDRPARRASLLSCLVPPPPNFQSLSPNPCFQLQNRSDSISLCLVRNKEERLVLVPSVYNRAKGEFARLTSLGADYFFDLSPSNSTLMPLLPP